jgi:SMC interacting uncharacterized protein involved in chromosome segregation
MKGKNELLLVERDDLLLKVQTFQSEMLIFEKEFQENSLLLSDLQKENKDLFQRNSSLHETVDLLKEEKEKEKTNFQETIAKMCFEQKEVQNEMFETFSQAESKITMIELIKEQCEQSKQELERELQSINQFLVLFLLSSLSAPFSFAFSSLSLSLLVRNQRNECPASQREERASRSKGYGSFFCSTTGRFTFFESITVNREE